MPHSIRCCLLVLLIIPLTLCVGAESSSDVLEQRFRSAVQPFLKAFCLDCHGAKKQEGKLDLRGYSSVASVVKNHGIWEILLERLEAEEMPPEKSPRHPTADERRAVVEWIKALRDREAQINAGDPGSILARRRSNAEYDYTIRDLTGVDIRPTREFPVDPANEAGFDNSGESLMMSPALVKKYLAAAKLVADHLVLKPQRFVFAPHPVVTETDRDKYCVKRIVDFYQRHTVDYADYFFAAWRFQHRSEFDMRDSLLADFAAPHDRPQKLSAKYLAIVWTAFSGPEALGPLAEIQAEWRKLPDDVSMTDEARRGCEQLRDLVLKLRNDFEPSVDRLKVRGISEGSQPLVLWRNQQLAAQRMSYIGEGKDPELDAARARFCRVFPDTFAVTSRGHYADPKLGAQVRLLTAGFHLMQGYFRDDEPLCELVLDDAENQELDELWQELNFVTHVPIRQYKDFLFFERAEPPRFAGGAEFDFARPEDKDVTSQAKLNRMRDAYLAKAEKNEASQQSLEAIENYFNNMSQDVRWIEDTSRAAEASHLEALLDFAERAYRRPLSLDERDDLLAFYHSLRGSQSSKDKQSGGNQFADAGPGNEIRERESRLAGLSHEDAIRDSIATVLMSPYFLYRFDLDSPPTADPNSKTPAHGGRPYPVRPLNDYELASRLSYFLWSSMPDKELLARAAGNNLHQPDVLVAQTRRMLQDHRVRGLATEFAGQWLEFRRFEQHNSVDRDRFPRFTDELRSAMFEEPVRFFMDVAVHNRSVLSFLYANHTFVNPVLAKHYGMRAEVDPSRTNVPGSDGWYRVDDAGQYGRGGLLPMSVFLTANSPGLRTSPVKRGYWVVRRLLGEHIPAPPPNVPELPKDEAEFGDLTLAQLLARHRDHQACAGCHQRFDSIGLVFEDYGPIGERRIVDLGGRPVDSKAVFPDDSEGTGLAGLHRYLATQREQDFIDNLCRKLLAYALNRSLIPSDRATIEHMRGKLAANEFRFASLVESIVTSRQFLNRRTGEN